MRTKSPPSDVKRVRARDSTSFDPRYKDALLAGLSAPFTLTFDTPREAIRFRARLQAYRFAVKRENTDPGLVLLLYRVKTTLIETRVVIEPVDFEFEKQLSSIQASQVEIPAPLSPAPDDLPKPETPTLDDLMSDLDNFLTHPSDEKEI